MELLFCEVTGSTDTENRVHELSRIGVEEIRLMINIVLEIDDTLEGHSCIRLNSKMITSTIIKVSSQ